MISYLGVIRTIMIADTSQFQRGMMSASKEMQKSAIKMRRDAQSLVGIGAALNVGITMPVALASRAIIKYGADYEAIMMKMRHVSGLTIQQFKLLEKEQMRISKQVGIDPRSLGQIGYYGAQAQLRGAGALTSFQRTVAKSLKTMPGESNPEAVAEGFLSVIKAFNIEEKDFGRTMAEMIKTIDLGRISWQEYTNTIQQVVALSSSLGTTNSLRNMNLSIAAATLGGVRGSQAATAVRNLYRRIYTEGAEKDSPMNLAAGMFGFRDKTGKGSAVKMFEEGAGGDLAKFSQMITFAGKMATPEYATAMGVMAREFTTFLKLATTAPSEMERFRTEYSKAPQEIENRYMQAMLLVRNQLEAVGAAWGRAKLAFFDAKTVGMLSNVLKSIIAFLDRVASLSDVSKNLIMLGAALATIGSIAILVVGTFKSMALTWRLNKIAARALLPGIAKKAVAGGAASASSGAMAGALAAGQFLYTPKGMSSPTQIRDAKGRIVKNLWAGSASAPQSKGIQTMLVGVLKQVKAFIGPLLVSIGKFSIYIIAVVIAFRALSTLFKTVLVPLIREMGIDLSKIKMSEFVGVIDILGALGDAVGLFTAMLVDAASIIIEKGIQLGVVVGKGTAIPRKVMQGDPTELRASVVAYVKAWKEVFSKPDNPIRATARILADVNKKQYASFYESFKMGQGRRQTQSALGKWGMEFNPIATVLGTGGQSWFNDLFKGVTATATALKMPSILSDSSSPLIDTFGYNEYGTSTQYSNMVSSQQSVVDILETIKNDERERLSLAREEARRNERERRAEEEFRLRWGDTPGTDLNAARVALDKLAEDVE